MDDLIRVKPKSLAPLMFDFYNNGNEAEEGA